MDTEFEEIGHSGGKVTFTITTDEEGRCMYQIGYGSSRPGPVTLIGIYALGGVPVGSYAFGGIGSASDPSPSGCYPVILASDSQGKFGHKCPQCRKYWRSGPWPNVCPYCALRAPSHEFLSEAQLRYVNHYCEVLQDALTDLENGEVEIDMDEVADAVGSGSEKPSFYVSEESQQKKFTCPVCDEYNDILGRFGYCSSCGTRNDLTDFEENSVQTIRERLNAGNALEKCLRDAASEFDSFMGQIAKELVNNIPLTEKRKQRLLKNRFYNIEEVCDIFKSWFDIDLCKGMKKGEYDHVALMFHRRHVHEHNGGEVDEKYLSDSGDTKVRLKQHLRETQEDVHMLLSCLVKMSRNVHEGFHEIFPPFPEPVEAFKEKKARIARYSQK